MKRKRPSYLIVILTLIVLGPFLRSIPQFFPHFINLVLGDIIYALAAYFTFAFLLIRKSSLTISLFSLLFCIAIEISQLYHAPWIDSIRSTRLGGYALGFGFLWSDMLAYLIGVSIGVLLEYWWKRKYLLHFFSDPGK